MATEPRIMQLLLSAHPDGLIVSEIGEELEIPRRQNTCRNQDEHGALSGLPRRCLEQLQIRGETGKAGFDNIDMEPTRIYSIEDARAFLSARNLDVDLLYLGGGRQVYQRICSSEQTGNGLLTLARMFSDTFAGVRPIGTSKAGNDPLTCRRGPKKPRFHRSLGEQKRSTDPNQTTKIGYFKLAHQRE
jgi:hypothetical protein